MGGFIMGKEVKDFQEDLIKIVGVGNGMLLKYAEAVNAFETGQKEVGSLISKNKELEGQLKLSRAAYEAQVEELENLLEFSKENHLEEISSLEETIENLTEEVNSLKEITARLAKENAALKSKKQI